MRARDASAAACGTTRATTASAGSSALWTPSWPSWRGTWPGTPGRTATARCTIDWSLTYLRSSTMLVSEGQRRVRLLEVESDNKWVLRYKAHQWRRASVESWREIGPWWLPSVRSTFQQMAGLKFYVKHHQIIGSWWPKFSDHHTS